MFSRTTSGWLLAATLMLLPACDSDNVSWAFVSNPGGSFGTTGGAVIWIRVTSSSSAGLEGAFVRADGLDDQGPVRVLLPHHGDFAVLQRNGSIELRSPALAFRANGTTRPGRFAAPGATLETPPPGGPAALRVHLPDCSIVHPAGAGQGTLHIAAAGTLMILDSALGIVVFGEQQEPEVLGLSVQLTTNPTGNAHALRLQDGRLRFLQAPPLPQPQQRLQPVPGRDALRLLGPTGEALAELPSSTVRLQNGAGGLFLQADLPPGTAGNRSAATLLMATANRYLLRIDA